MSSDCTKEEWIRRVEDCQKKKEVLVVVEYQDLIKDPSEVKELFFPLFFKAFGEANSLGAIAIRNVPEFGKWKDALLPMGHKLANLSPEYLEEHLTDAVSLYNAGWSYGKEKLGNNAQPDTSKGSFYYNPITDVPGTEEDRQKYPCSYPCNKWPSEDTLPGFQTAAKTLGTVMKEAVVHLSQHIDVFAKHQVGPAYPDHLLYHAFQHTEKVKGRLLYYYPPPNDPSDTDTWIGWHSDSGFLTALAGDLYMHHDTGEIMNHIHDATAGLHIMKGNGEVVKAVIPEDCMAVQIGECVQILTGGALRATPHCVKMLSHQPHIARISHPCFIDTPPSFPLTMPPGSTTEAVTGTSPSIIPPLAHRWTHNGMPFGDFLQKSFETYYQWSK